MKIHVPNDSNRGRQTHITNKQAAAMAYKIH